MCFRYTKLGPRVTEQWCNLYHIVAPNHPAGRTQLTDKYVT